MPADAIIMRLKAQSVRFQTTGADGKVGEDVEMWAVYDPDPNSPNYSFSKATPSAQLKFHLSNPHAFGFFGQGNEYDVVITRRQQ